MKNLICCQSNRGLRKAPPLSLFPKLFIRTVNSTIEIPKSHGPKSGGRSGKRVRMNQNGQNKVSPEICPRIPQNSLLSLDFILWNCCFLFHVARERVLFRGKSGKTKWKGRKIRSPIEMQAENLQTLVSCFFKYSVFNRPKENLDEVILM